MNVSPDSCCHECTELAASNVQVLLPVVTSSLSPSDSAASGIGGAVVLHRI
jgi:hypothetical protein